MKNKNKERPIKEMTTRELPKDVAETLDFWLHHKFKWWRLHYSLGLAALLCSVTVASGPKFEHLFRAAPVVLDILAWISAICIALVTFLMPTRRARAYVAAARVLSDARNRYVNDANYPLEKLLDAVQKGEDIIARSDPI
jgi:hypothetical protein